MRSAGWHVQWYEEMRLGQIEPDGGVEVAARAVVGPPLRRPDPGRDLWRPPLGHQTGQHRGVTNRLVARQETELARAGPHTHRVPIELVLRIGNQLHRHRELGAVALRNRVEKSPDGLLVMRFADDVEAGPDAL